MTGFRLEPAADRRLDEIYIYSRERWGEIQANSYIREMVGAFDDIANRRVPWRRIPAEFGIDGYFRRHREHVSYWRLGTGETVLFFAILHVRMHQTERLRDELEH